MKITSISNISFKSNIIQKTLVKERTSDISYCDLNNQPSNTINQSLVKSQNGQLLKPKCFSTNPKNYESCLSIFRKRKFDYIQHNSETEEIEFKKELNPQKLPITKEQFKGFEIDNFVSPNGSIALQTRLKTALSTSSLYQCAAVSFVDRKNNLQSLLHLCPTIDRTANKNLLKYLISNCDKDNLEISIVHGYDNYTDDTITFLMDFVKNNCPNAQINFMDYPDEEHDILVLYNGDLQVLDENKNFEPLSINPYSKIIYA